MTRVRRRTPADVLAWSVGAGGLIAIAGFIAIPLVSLVVWTATSGAWGAITSPTAVDALLLSARTTATTMMILVVAGTPAAYVLARVHFPGNRVINTLVDLPVALPPSAAGIALLLAFGRQGFLGEHLHAFGITLSFTTVAVVMAELFVAAPFYLRAAVTGFARAERDIEEAALVDGADRVGVFFRITVRLVAPALIAGALTAWARALGEFGATIVFAGNFPGVTQTVPLAIYSVFQNDLDAAVALSVLVLSFAFAVILATRYASDRLRR